ncbi:uncharacterized protein PHACADRAFT_250819 [Phanerochaete carnosa HHB-10118-sp]|uniref:Uncharacterized protein n=1 Tax=Phanerochaete carnosa (strain HHB-10118-sp) TaxID=650164 RepID=K5VAU2_PHACS|nr:uncharacterized protein PHACADRAFT_250819 [Phanerochaete carnosa HHB-10118-sp]EKM59986.1 hypothetical protein PHACADRAFT_250819 [Phanerochaete carnosa HHB-10118-sp]
MDGICCRLWLVDMLPCAAPTASPGPVAEPFSDDGGPQPSPAPTPSPIPPPAPNPPPPNACCLGRPFPAPGRPPSAPKIEDREVKGIDADGVW